MYNIHKSIQPLFPKNIDYQNASFLLCSVRISVSCIMWASKGTVLNFSTLVEKLENFDASSINLPLHPRYRQVLSIPWCSFLDHRLGSDPYHLP